MKVPFALIDFMSRVSKFANFQVLFSLTHEESARGTLLLKIVTVRYGTYECTVHGLPYRDIDSR